ncbi:nuclear apoptosis-inducing factor 1-like [Ambystoma mexicanum]|uniref:nuclear apoptosis-inducing factor 1-like n=1 Tax=Ambystoma mexicanum TaxID=8296 RepID=UPI0037E7C8EC
MPKAVKKRAVRQRKERFSNEELTMLADTLAANTEVVFANDMWRPALIKKKEIWAEVAQKVSAVGSTPRIVKDVRKLWEDLRLSVRSILAANRSLAMGTGGGGGSPIKLQECKETCASTIGVESIEGVGEMERSMPSSSDGGSQSDSEEQDSGTQAPPPKKQAKGMEVGTSSSTLRGTGKSALPQRAKATHPPTSPRREMPSDNVVAPIPAIPTMQDPLAEGSLWTCGLTTAVEVRNMAEQKMDATTMFRSRCCEFRWSASCHGAWMMLSAFRGVCRRAALSGRCLCSEIFAGEPQCQEDDSHTPRCLQKYSN